MSAQIESIQFKGAEYIYSFGPDDEDITVWIDDGVELHQSSGQILILVPFSPIERKFKVPFSEYLDNNSEAFFFGGLLDGAYDFSVPGKYQVRGRGVMRVNDSNVGRGYAADITIIVDEEYLELQIETPFLLDDYGFDTAKIQQKSLTEEFTVRIRAKAY